MRRKSQIIFIAMVSCAMLGSLLGCGGEPSSAPSDVTPVPPKPETADSQPDVAPVPVPDSGAAQAPPPVAVAAAQYVAPVPEAVIKWVVSGENLIQNGGFEQEADTGPAFWLHTIKDVKPELTQKTAYQGTRALQVALEPEVNFGMGQRVNVKSGSSYRLTGYVKTQGVTDGVWIEVQDGEKGFESFAKRSSDKPVIADEWTKQSIEFEVPNGVTSLNVLVRRPVTEVKEAKKGTVWFDGVTLHEVQPTSDPSLLSNGSFEDTSNPLNGWTDAPDSAVTSDDAAVGEASLKVELPEDSNLGIRTVVGVQEGESYVLSGQIKTEKLAATARLEVSDALKGHEAFVKYNDGITGTNGWTDLHLLFTVPQGTTGINVLLRVVDLEKGGGPGKVWFDGYQLHKIIP